ncbi:hydantoinase/carbamoylase family amidase [Devosia sp. Root635]|uniref:hydantoinase/carbamoylase family amidase n=1 Tax=Devosia sp. Root635 TaxID=1736575 RepID=UPI0006FE254E|nr:hydantoinase/carbamoylase family amidase [Devosia sp. Root635]KRA40237.1 Zn-dependent hydrolase [Devosia sp. Root635]
MTAAPVLDSEALATQLFDRLAAVTGDGVGITRECYGEGEDAALAIFREAAEDLGLVVEADSVANLIVRLPEDDGTVPAHYIGSHADSVPQGGNFDGAAGIIAGLLCLARIRQSGRTLTQPVRVIMLRGEESAFYGRANIGSRVLFGLLDPSDLEARSRGKGRTLGEAMEATGIDLGPIREGEVLFDAKGALSYLELHIEQGPVMVARDLPTSVVSGIRGNIRHRKVVCRGEAGHSGAIPRWLRKDPVFAFAELIGRLDEHWRTLLERGLDLVVTSGVVSTDAADHAISRIPGEIGFSFEIRSQSRDTLEAFYELFRSECRAVAAQRGVRFEFDERVVAEPARMDDGIIARLSEMTERCGLPLEVLPSGAGHDAAVFANAGVPSGMIFVRNRNGSHNPDEAMEIADFLKGVDVLHGLVTAGN